MYKCDICGRELKKKISCYGYILCSKHMHQFHKYGKFLDNNPRTENDLNGFRIINDIVEFDVYNKKSEVVDQFIIDLKDLNKVRYHKWREDTHGRIITGNSTNKNPRRELSRFLLDVSDDAIVVDHKDGNPKNNRRNNLRICKQKDNLCNKSFMSNNTSEFIGVSYDKQRHRWAPEIRKDEIRCHLGRYKNKEEAVFARHIAEIILFKEYRNTNQDNLKNKLFEKITLTRKQEIENYVKEKLSTKY